MMDDVAKVKALTSWSLNTLASARHAGGHEAAGSADAKAIQKVAGQGFEAVLIVASQMLVRDRRRPDRNVPLVGPACKRQGRERRLLLRVLDVRRFLRSMKRVR